MKCSGVCSRITDLHFICRDVVPATVVWHQIVLNVMMLLDSAVANRELQAGRVTDANQVTGIMVQEDVTVSINFNLFFFKFQSVFFSPFSKAAFVTACGCNQEYSVGFGCNPATGQCECLPGVTGEKCDHCPYRWVLKEEEGCFECDACTHGLLNVTDELAATIDPQMRDFEVNIPPCKIINKLLCTQLLSLPTDFEFTSFFSL